VHVIDFEGSIRTGVVEFGVVTLRGGAIERCAAGICRPRGKVRAEETAVHGLDEARLAVEAPFESHWATFSALRETGVLAAHFAATENALLRGTWPCPRLSPDFLRPGSESAEWGPWIDSGRLVQEWRADTGTAALADVVARLGLSEALEKLAEEMCAADRRRYHCALFDALAAALVLVALGYDAAGEPHSLAHMLASSTADSRRRDERRQGTLF
jgi:DNA polymerase-3 subunit epsilon